jgi:hypothetical protein
MIRRCSLPLPSLHSVASRWQSHFLLLLLILSACASLPTATPPPTPQILVIARPLALQGWDEKIHTCAKNYPQLAVFVNDNLPGAQTTPKPAVTLQLGNPYQPADNTYLLGQEEIYIAANTAFPDEELSLSQLQDFVTTSLTIPASPKSRSLPVQFWTYPPGDEARAAFEQAVLPDGSLSTYALIAIEPSAMLEALEKDPTAFGYLPASSLSQASADQQSKIKVIKLKETPADFLRQPVVASLSTSPSPLVKAYLQCLSGSGY